MGAAALQRDQTTATASAARPASLRIALVGNPNSGKSTLFNALTGMRQRVANFPGVTVERVEGEYQHAGTRVSVIDLPGAYSLSAGSPDEEIALDVLHGRAADVDDIDVVVVVVDAENIERNLFFATEILELGRPTVIALNRMDRAARAGLRIDVIELMHELEAVVVPVVATRGTGIDRLRHAIQRAPSLPRPAARAAVDTATEKARYDRIADVLDRVTARRPAAARTRSDRIDAVVLHRVWGPLIFLGVMAVVFQSMFSWARPLADGIQWLVGGGAMLLRNALPPGELRSLLVEGVLAGVGSVLVFLPQIALLFLFIGILEDSGYMARAAFVMDRYMRPLGLHGKSFIPLISGYACAVPAIMSTRTIQQPKERLATIMVVPLMSCSARLPVYTLLVGAFVPAVAVGHVFSLQGLTLLAMYLLGTVAALVSAFAFRRTLLRSDTRALIIELPSYSMPNGRVLASSVWQRVRLFLRRAGTIIFAISIVLWGLAHYPRPEAGATQEQALAQSALGTIGHTIEPAVRPLGYDWKLGVSMISSFAAREVFVSTMATIYGVENGSEDSPALTQRLRSERDPRTGKFVYTPLIAIGLMVFYVFALMCTSTVTMTARETGGGLRGMGWAALQFGYMLVLAYGGALLVFRLGMALGLGGGA
ncbi:MAG TPA: ferrous iron transport protein B [Gemmatimonadaceae bacterium]